MRRSRVSVGGRRSNGRAGACGTTSDAVGTTVWVMSGAGGCGRCAGSASCWPRPCASAQSQAPSVGVLQQSWAVVPDPSHGREVTHVVTAAGERITARRKTATRFRNTLSTVSTQTACLVPEPLVGNLGGFLTRAPVDRPDCAENPAPPGTDPRPTGSGLRRIAVARHTVAEVVQVGWFRDALVGAET